MVRIKIDTIALSEKSKVFESSAGVYAQGGSELLSLVAGLPSYEGQLSGYGIGHDRMLRHYDLGCDHPVYRQLFHFRFRHRENEIFHQVQLMFGRKKARVA